MASERTASQRNEEIPALSSRHSHWMQIFHLFKNTSQARRLEQLEKSKETINFGELEVSHRLE